jgi:hypothetical protein
MAGKLITLPLRVSLRSAQLLTRAAGGVAERAMSVTGLAIQIVSPGRSSDLERDVAPVAAPRAEPAAPPAAPAAPPSAAPAAPPSAAPAAPPATPRAAAPATPLAAPPAVPLDALTQAPAHVSEEPELVAESAEPGAEEGAGAGITVVEPWAGYGRLTAKDVIDRARTASVAELAAMRLYEARHRARQTVLAAVDRQLRLADGGRPA